MGNHIQNKRTPKTNKPKLTTKEKKAKKDRKAAEKVGGITLPGTSRPG